MFYSACEHLIVTPDLFLVLFLCGWFPGFGSDAENPHLPHNHEENQVVYTGTHDNDTVAEFPFYISILPSINSFLVGSPWGCGVDGRSLSLT